MKIKFKFFLWRTEKKNVDSIGFRDKKLVDCMKTAAYFALQKYIVFLEWWRMARLCLVGSTSILPSIHPYSHPKISDYNMPPINLLSLCESDIPDPLLHFSVK